MLRTFLQNDNGIMLSYSYNGKSVCFYALQPKILINNINNNNNSNNKNNNNNNVNINISDHLRKIIHH
jgi:hypothetical protein